MARAFTVGRVSAALLLITLMYLAGVTWNVVRFTSAGNGSNSSSSSSSSSGSEVAGKHRPAHKRVVEIWGKAAIADYLWQHICGFELQEKMGGVWFYGQGGIGKHELRFRSGPGVTPKKVPRDTTQAVMVLNAHNDEKVATALPWVQSIPSHPTLQDVGIVLLANEFCNNSWLLPFLADPAYKIRFVLTTYNSEELINGRNILQWPLGVATYRSFPARIPHQLAVSPESTARRQWLCNFQATIYPNSSRAVLLDVIKTHGLESDCFVKTRSEWVEKEETPLAYRESLLHSELTLSPAGLNTECYRWYEAAACGSTPVVEDVVQPAACGRDPLALMREYHAPFIYIKTWHELPDLLQKEKLLTPSELSARRKALVEWYRTFKQQMRDRFGKALDDFFG